MTDSTPQPFAAFRLNLEQQKKRAKELLKSARSGDPVTMQRMQRQGFDTAPDALRLARAQHCIARELRFSNWSALKTHIAEMEHTRETLRSQHVIDADCPTMHIRCGHDIRQTLKDAGFQGEFNLHINPYLQGPVTADADWLQRRARFITDNFGPYQNLKYEEVLQDCREEEARLERASRDFERVVLWFEHDRFDQFVLLRCLAWFAQHGAPPRLELVSTNDFPGSRHFLGLGQLPPEALRILWTKRSTLGTEHVLLGQQAWEAFRAPDPRGLGKLMQSTLPLLPYLPAALHRHLQELPSLHNGLGLTHQLLLQTIGEFDSIRISSLVGLVIGKHDPLTSGDISMDTILRELAAVPEPLVLREDIHEVKQWTMDTVTITKAGRRLLAGEVNWLELPVAERWVGGVRIAPGQRNWHWDERRHDLILH
jgi:hypothetical protein